MNAKIINPTNQPIPVDLVSGSTISVGGTFNIPKFDYESFTYVGGGVSNDDRIATQVFKTGGSGGTTVATLTYAYSGSTNNITSITQS